MPVAARSFVFGTALLTAGCPALPDDGSDNTEEVSVDVVVDTGPCPAAPAGIALEETAPFLPGDDARAESDAGDGVVVLMGGSTEVDRASARFVDGARGGDVLVLRATGSTSSYTGYFANDLAVTTAPRAVGTIRIDDAAVADDESVLCRVRRAEAIWFAGGDQSDYLVAWPATLHAAIAQAIARGAAVGGTSAGAMSLSEFAFDARGGGVTSDEAIAAPDDAVISVSASPFPAVAGVVVDTHFSARDREGRLLVFMAHAAGALGLGLDEETAVVLDGDDATVLADSGGAAFAYEASGTSLDGGLQMERLLRRRLGDGATTTWPPAFDGADAFVVADGVVTPE